ncbi:MAG: trigger factor [Bacteroidota bacterium]|nr:trigger factor [Bacteroidota bacterium]
MNIIKENIDELNGVIKVSIAKADYEATVKATLNDHRKKANVPGFRPGKVPASLIKKMYGKHVLVDEVNKLLSNELTKYLIDEKLNILGEPLPNEEQQKVIDWDKDEDFEFVFDIAVAPEVKVSLDKRNKLPFYTINVDDDLVNRQIDAYANRFGENNEVEVVAEKSTVRGNIEQLNVENPIKAEDTLIAVDLIADESIRGQFVGASVETTITFDIRKAFPNAQELAHMLKIEKPEAEKIEGECSFTIKKINEFITAEVNEELFKKVYGDDSITTLEEFKNKIREGLSSSLNSSSDYRFLIDTRDTLVEKFKFELPTAFLKRWLKVTNKDLTEEQIESDFENFAKDLKWQLIKNTIITENEIKVAEEEIKEMAKAAALSQFQQYGIFNIPEEYIENYSNQLLQKEEDRHRLFQRKEEEKVLACIREKVTIENKEVDQEEFNKLFKKE